MGGASTQQRNHLISDHPAAKEGTWIQTTTGKGWFTLLRLYSPKEPFFTKEWRPSEIELVK